VKIIAPYKMEIPKSKKSEGLSHGLQNPYMNRVMIQDIDEFYGRNNEIEKIYSRIGSSRPQSISIVGERRIGKSSLLNFINHPLNRSKYLKNPDEYVFVFIDFQERRGIQIREFFAIIFQALLYNFHGNLEIGLEPNYEGFKQVVSLFDEHKLKLILLFDEFELITKNENFDTEFYSFCRSIANNFNVAYIISSGKNLQTLCHSRQISDSPFFNIFSNLTLSQFSRGEAVDLICNPAAKSDISMRQYVDFVLDIAGYYPFFIQMACASLYEHLRDKGVNKKTMLDMVKEDFLDEAKVHFQQIWATADEDQREVLLILAYGKKVSPAQEYQIKILEKEGYVKQGRKRPEIFSSLFKEYILDRYGSGGKSPSRIWPFGKSVKYASR
jgi:serine/threonine-protein kinase